MDSQWFDVGWMSKTLQSRETWRQLGEVNGGGRLLDCLYVPKGKAYGIENMSYDE